MNTSNILLQVQQTNSDNSAGVPSSNLCQCTRILVYRHVVWNATPLHSWDTQSPPPLGYLRDDCGEGSDVPTTRVLEMSSDQNVN